MKLFTLAILAASIAPVAVGQTVYRDTRPIHGAWLRPPSTLASLETNLNQCAQAGITDLFLETFYHGIATNNSSVFNDRFAFDYLADAIRLGAKYNVRVHAWLESGYWQFQTTGAYNFAANPEWQVLNIATGLTGGDGTPGQVFANLGNPGVQNKLRQYCAELANYAGLWGIQTDYHRFPLDNNTGDAFTVPWSYDSWSRSTFQGLFGSDPQVTAATPAGPQWANFLTWRRNGISEAANQMHQGINAVNPSIEFSAAIFASAMSSSAQIAKCQNWPAWAAAGYVEWLVPMAYGPTASSITTDINLTLASSATRRVIAGLALGSGHPSITNQLNAVKNASTRIEDFVFFEAGAFSTAASRDELRFWILNQTMTLRGDFDTDADIDTADRALLNSIYTGTPVPVNAANRRYDLNADNVINGADVTSFNSRFAKYRFGEDGIVDTRDLAALRACFGQSPVVAGVPHLYDLDGDNDCDYADQVVFHSLATVDLPDDLDVNADGRVSIEDLVRQSAAPLDVNRNGVIDANDAETLRAALRGIERTDVAADR